MRTRNAVICLLVVGVIFSVGILATHHAAMPVTEEPAEPIDFNTDDDWTEAAIKAAGGREYVCPQILGFSHPKCSAWGRGEDGGVR